MDPVGIEKGGGGIEAAGGIGADAAVANRRHQSGGDTRAGRRIHRAAARQGRGRGIARGPGAGAAGSDAIATTGKRCNLH